MVDLISQIRAGLSTVVTQFADELVPIYYRELTSAFNANPRTWSSWTQIVGARVTDATDTTRADPVRNVHARYSTYNLRVPFSAGVDLGRESQIRVGSASTGLIYTIERQQPNGAGACDDYVIAWSEPVMVNPRQGAGT